MAISVEWAGIGLAAGLLLFVLGGFLWFFRKLRHRRRSIEEGAEPTPVPTADRAYNQIQLARSAAEHLARQGRDVSRSRALIDQADAAFQRGAYDTALGLSSTARELLLPPTSATPSPPPPGSRAPLSPAAPSAPSSPPPGVSPAMSPPLGPAAPMDAEEAPPEAPTPRLPKNKAESRFQLTLLDEELSRSAGGGANGGSVEESKILASQARQAFDRGDFTEALRLGLKGRRRLGARLETLPPPAAPETERPPAAAGDSAPGSCSTCGQPLRANDKFCRGCGAPRTAPRCAACGEALAGDDRFCGACGAPIRT